MKNYSIHALTTIIFLIFTNTLFSQAVTVDEAQRSANSFLDYHAVETTLINVEPFSDGEALLAWVANLNPVGFILISPTKQQLPVTAYSFESNWLIDLPERDRFLTLMRADLSVRLDYPETSPEYVNKCHNEWMAYLTHTKTKNRFEQWPPEGSTPTGGWLFVNWGQGSPYNKMCPIDLNTHNRSLAGCPAVAMAMILNCGNEINHTRFTDTDDYYHSYGAGNQYWIDDDWQAHGFPYFDSLNLYIDSIEENFGGHKPLTEMQAAALHFACGTALKQVYTSSISGTFGIEQAR
nr:C10 family peptidase [Bacteroidota bacterium]